MSNIEFETVQYETQEGIARIILNRPERLNSISKQLISDLKSAIDLVELDKSIRVVLITGAGRAFCAGADIKERAENLKSDAVQATAAPISHLFRRLELMAPVFIAAINGVAAGGGCELAMACDFRIASEQATFALPEVRLGILPGAGGTQRLPRLVGTTRAKEMMLTARFIDANEAFNWGLINKVATHDDLMPSALGLAEQLMEQAPMSVRLIKSAINTGIEMDIDAGLKYEQECSEILARSEDRIEGYNAFVEKRRPIFKGR